MSTAGFAAVHVSGDDGKTSGRQTKFSMNWLAARPHPGHAVDSGNAGIGHPRQHVVQSVAEFMEQRSDFVMRQQRGALPTAP